MLMSGRRQPAKVHYLAGTFRVLSHGDYVLCAVTGRPIDLDDLRYWSVARQEAYVDASTSMKADQEAGAR